MFRQRAITREMSEDISRFFSQPLDAPAPLALCIRDLTVTVQTSSGPLQVVRGANLDIPSRSALALVGESGSGKSMTAASILRLQNSTISIGGSIEFEGTDLLQLSERQMGSFRGRKIGMIFQDPQRALNPMLKIGDQLTEILTYSLGEPPTNARQMALDALDQVRIPKAKERLKAYPHELSGGMKQRIMIAMAILPRPSLIIADEPTTALDVHVQRDILDLLKSIQRDMHLSMLFITHDFGVVEYIAEDVAVMNAGRIVEYGPKDDVLGQPEHPYTQNLIASVMC